MGGDGVDLHLQPITGGKLYVELQTWVSSVPLVTSQGFLSSHQHKHNTHQWDTVLETVQGILFLSH